MQMDEVVDGDVDGDEDEDDVKSFQDLSSGVVNLLGVPPPDPFRRLGFHGFSCL